MLHRLVGWTRLHWMFPETIRKSIAGTNWALATRGWSCGLLVVILQVVAGQQMKDSTPSNCPWTFQRTCRAQGLGTDGASMVPAVEVLIVNVAVHNILPFCLGISCKLGLLLASLSCNAHAMPICQLAGPR
jgi:hypothetical protein